MEAVGLLHNLTESEDGPEPAVTLYLLGDILNRVNTSMDSENQTVFIKVCSI